MSGAIDLLQQLKKSHIPHGIATSGEKQSILPSLKALKIDKSVVVIDGSSAGQAKPAPDLFLKCSKRLSIPPKNCCVVGDAIWDVLAAGRPQMSPVSLTCGGYGKEELYRAGAARVYKNPAEVLAYLHQVGIEL
jgi:HAD superfamily hydrolase (TIGR01509 family)